MWCLRCGIARQSSNRQPRENLLEYGKKKTQKNDSRFILFVGSASSRRRRRRRSKCNKIKQNKETPIHHFHEKWESMLSTVLFFFSAPPTLRVMSSEYARWCFSPQKISILFYKSIVVDAIQFTSLRSLFSFVVGRVHLSMCWQQSKSWLYELR